VLGDHADIEKGREQAKTRGFGESVPEPADLAERRRRAEEITSELQAPGYDVLTPEERAEFVSLVASLKDALDANK
jgi:2-oxo-4-hydroxy-4-carboxy--5-ureidoimidazoline (OHCU) decarboxylase